MPIDLTLDQAKALAIHAQGLSQTPSSSSTKELDAILPALGAVQLDTISTLARSHELVHYARSAGVSRTQVETALWGDPPHTFEYWSHAACVLPMNMFPYFATRRRGFVAKKGTWDSIPSAKTIRTVKKRLSENAATATQLGGAKKGGDWWDWSETKEALEWLLAIGEVVCTQRVGWRRVYSLTQDSVPQHLLNSDNWSTSHGVLGPSDDECITALLLDAIRTLGVGTENDLIDVHRLSGWHTNRAHVRKLLAIAVENGDVIPVTVQGWSDPTYASPQSLKQLGRKSLSLGSATTLLSPFDSLVWHRERVARLFGMDYRLEAYTPAPKRIYGYFAMPVLHDSALVARVDPGRVKEGRDTVMVAKTVTFETNARGTVSSESISGTAQALVRGATWVNATRIELGDVKPASAQPRLAKALAGLQR